MLLSQKALKYLAESGVYILNLDEKYAQRGSSLPQNVIKFGELEVYFQYPEYFDFFNSLYKLASDTLEIKDLECFFWYICLLKLPQTLCKDNISRPYALDVMLQHGRIVASITTDFTSVDCIAALFDHLIENRNSIIQYSIDIRKT